MRKALQFFEALDQTKRSNIISLLETAIELENATCLATHDDDTRDRVSDGCIFLAFLRFGEIGNVPPS